MTKQLEPSAADQRPQIYFRSTNDMKETIRLVEEDGWNEGELFWDDLKDFRRAVGSGRDTKDDYEYMRDFMTYLINKNNYWKEENNE